MKIKSKRLAIVKLPDGKCLDVRCVVLPVPDDACHFCHLRHACRLNMRGTEAAREICTSYEKELPTGVRTFLRKHRKGEQIVRYDPRDDRALYTLKPLKLLNP